MAYVISVVNQKGGVGKTTTVVHLSSALARLGYPILVVDLDPQANVSTTLGLIDPYEVKTTIATLMLDICHHTLLFGSTVTWNYTGIGSSSFKKYFSTGHFYQLFDDK